MSYRPMTFGALALAAGVHGAMACGYHPGLSSATFETVHPKSLAVAVAIRQAKDGGLLPAIPGSASLPTFAGVGYRNAVAELRQLRDRLAHAASTAETGRDVRFALVFVQTRLWTQFAIAPGATEATIHAPPAGDGETVVLTDEAVLEAILEERMSLEVAVERGLVQFSNDRDGAAAAVLRAALSGGPSSPAGTSTHG